MLRMVGGHACYTPFDPEKLFKEDAPGAEVKNRFLNRCFVYILYKCCIAEPHSCLSWIFPTSSSDKDLERLSKRTMPAGDPNHPGRMISFLGPEIPASVAAAVMSLPWHTFHGLRNPPPFLEWYQRQLQHFRTWGRDACAEKIRAALKMERSYTKTVREDAKRLRTEKRAAKRAENIAKLEARLNKMKLSAGRKNGPVKTYTSEEIAALNAARA